jgi:hypothetical protein
MASPLCLIVSSYSYHAWSITRLRVMKYGRPCHALSPADLCLLKYYWSCMHHRISIVVSFTQFVRVELSKRVFHLGGDSFDSFFGEADTRER